MNSVFSLCVIGVLSIQAALADAANQCSAPSTSTAVSEAAEAALQLISSPTNFTRKGHKIVEGAVYDHEGNVVCIRNDDPAAYLSDESKTTSGSTPSVSQCERIAARSRKLTLSNGELLNRLLWSAGEGNCNAVASDVVDATGAKVWSPATAKGKALMPIRFATYYHGFVFNNLRRYYRSEDEMLQQAANGGPGLNFFNSYFVAGWGNTKPYFKLVLEPAKWTTATAADAFESDLPEKKIAHCLRALLPSLVPGAPDPTDGAAFWVHSETGCSPGSFQMKVRFGGVSAWSRDIHSCFRAKF